MFSSNVNLRHTIQGTKCFSSNSSSEKEKVSKYLPLARDFHLMYHMVVEVIPIVFGYSGVVSIECVKYLKKIPGYCDNLFTTLQKATILGTILTINSTKVNFI